MTVYRAQYQRQLLFGIINQRRQTAASEVRERIAEDFIDAPADLTGTVAQNMGKRFVFAVDV